MTLIADAPNTPASPTVEALNAIFDIYADVEFDYDGPVFVNNDFLAHLSKALPNVRIMVSIFLCGYIISDKTPAPGELFIGGDLGVNFINLMNYSSSNFNSGDDVRC